MSESFFLVLVFPPKTHVDKWIPPRQPCSSDSQSFTFTFTDNGPQTGFSERTARCQRRRRRRSRREFMASLSRTGVSRTFGRHAIHSRTKNRLLAGQNKSGLQSFPLLQGPVRSISPILGLWIMKRRINPCPSFVALCTVHSRGVLLRLANDWTLGARRG